jgi:hypothetical protein
MYPSATGCCLSTCSCHTVWRRALVKPAVGFALYGILLVNIPWPIITIEMRRGPPSGGLYFAVDLLQYTVHGRFFPIFSPSRRRPRVVPRYCDRPNPPPSAGAAAPARRARWPGHSSPATASRGGADPYAIIGVLGLLPASWLSRRIVLPLGGVALVAGILLGGVCCSSRRCSCLDSPPCATASSRPCCGAASSSRSCSPSPRQRRYCPLPTKFVRMPLNPVSQRTEQVTVLLTAAGETGPLPVASGFATPWINVRAYQPVAATLRHLLGGSDARIADECARSCFPFCRSQSSNAAPFFCPSFSHSRHGRRHECVRGTEFSWNRLWFGG